MDPLNIAALDALTAAVRSLLSQNDAPVRFKSVKIKPTGLGGLVGRSGDPDPPGELTGRTVEGMVAVVAMGADVASLGAAAVTLIRELVGASRKDLIAAGIQRLSLDSMEPHRVMNPNELEQEVCFGFCFDYVHRPETAGDLIDKIHVEMDGQVPEIFEINNS